MRIAQEWLPFYILKVMEIKIHPEFLVDHRPKIEKAEVYDQVYDQVYDEAHDFRLSDSEIKILALLSPKYLSLKEILLNFGYQVLTGNIRIALNNLLKLEFIAHTIPGKPRSKRQQYKITQKGKDFLERCGEKDCEPSAN